MSISAQRLFTSSFSLWILFALVGAYFVFPLTKHIKFGIDLVGGTYITLEVQTEEAIRVHLVGRMQGIAERLKVARLEAPTSQKVEKDKIVLTFSSPAAASAALSILRSDFADMAIEVASDVITLKLTSTEIKRLETEAVEGNVAVLETRLNRAGVSEISVAPHGQRNIVVELPQVKNPELAKAMIGKSAMLEIKLVEKASPTEEALLYEYDGDIPDGMVVAHGKGGRGDRDMFYLVPDYADLTGRLLEREGTRAGIDESRGGEPVVHFEFKREGGDKFYDLTSKHHGRQIAIIIDGEVISAPSVSVPISTRGYIHGGFTWEQADELASLLRSGAFVAPVKFAEERSVGPLLGHESIRQGLIACIVGLILIFGFSVFVYRLAGLFAFMALLYNMVLIMFALAWFKATLTLPGIAGMLLTVGMAVDASILIYERIREDLAEGASLRKAVGIGFSDAMKVILDANVTTFIVGFVLFQFGTGPIRGFAVTMMIGIVSTLITGLFFLRSIFNLAMDGFGVQKMRF